MKLKLRWGRSIESYLLGLLVELKVTRLLPTCRFCYGSRLPGAPSPVAVGITEVGLGWDRIMVWLLIGTFRPVLCCKITVFFKILNN